MVHCDTHIEDAAVHEKELDIGITFHRLGLIIAAITGLLSILFANYLIVQHALHYLKPSEQRHIIRILFMIPIYSMVSFLSYYYYQHAIYYQVLRDCYEAFAISSFFTLMCHYIAPNLHEQKNFFRQETPINWIWPLNWFQKCTGGQDRGILRKPRSGLTWFNLIYSGVYQYCFFRVFFTIVSVVTQVFDRYCEASLHPAFAHIWVLVFETLSVTVAMYALIQFYAQLKTNLAEHKPFLKLLCIKLVIFFSFWQNLVISLLSSTHGPLQPTKYLSWPDIRIGIPSVLLCCEMAMFSVLHLFAFPWRKPYGRPKKFSAESESYFTPGTDYPATPQYQGGPFGIKAYLDAYNPWDIIKASARGFRWIFVDARKRNRGVSYKNDDPTWGIVGGGPGEASNVYGYAPPAGDATKLEPINGVYSRSTPGLAISEPTDYESSKKAGLYYSESHGYDRKFTPSGSPAPSELRGDDYYYVEDGDHSALLQPEPAAQESKDHYYSAEREVDIDELDPAGTHPAFRQVGHESWGRGQRQ